MGKTRCKKKWCPCCAPGIAAKKNRRLQNAIGKFRWPLFITLTMKNVDDLNFGAVRQLRQAFGRLRHRKFWTKAVKGGVASIEVTNIGNGWHPHLHAVVDCRWLAVNEMEPRPNWTKEAKMVAFTAATDEVCKVWARILQQPTASIKIKRASSGTILKEVVKYSVKGSELAECQGEIGQLVDAIEGTRLLTTFGSVFGIGDQPDPGTRVIAQVGSTNGGDPEPEREVCCSRPEMLPREIWEIMARPAKKR